MNWNTIDVCRFSGLGEACLAVVCQYAWPACIPDCSECYVEYILSPSYISFDFSMMFLPINMHDHEVLNQHLRLFHDVHICRLRVYLHVVYCRMPLILAPFAL